MKLVDFALKEIPINEVHDPELEHYGVSVSVLRSDLIHPQISGNKWFKLKYNLLKAQEQQQKTLLSFGGAWSNHIHALAAAGRLFGFKTIGIIRGERGQELNACLSDAVTNGMTLQFVSREEYRQKHEESYRESLQEKYGDFALIPEGGANLEGLKGCKEILGLANSEKFDQVCLACGTGTTLAGVASLKITNTIGFQVLRGESYIKDEVLSLLNQYQLKADGQWSVNEDYHFGGYAKTKTELFEFMANFEKQTGIPLEPIYSGKMLYGIYDLIKQGFFKRGTKILIIHGGGLQGRRGFA